MVQVYTAELSPFCCVSGMVTASRRFTALCSTFLKLEPNQKNYPSYGASHISLLGAFGMLIRLCWSCTPLKLR